MELIYEVNPFDRLEAQDYSDRSFSAGLAIATRIVDQPANFTPFPMACPNVIQ